MTDPYNDFVRPDYRIDVIYKMPAGGYFVSPDGAGRYFYETLAGARDQHGVLPLRHATRAEADA